MSTATVCFGDFRLDPARRELWRGNQRLRLPARVFDCIAYLVAHRDRAVGRDELIEAIWGHADVSDNTLDQVVLRARRALHDTGDERRIILTKPRFGYIWGAPTEIVDPPAVRHAPAAAPATAVVSRRWPLWPLMMAGVVLIVLAALMMARNSVFTPEPAALTQRALVLPIAVDAGSEFAWVRLGVMDLIAEHLRAAGLAVVPSDNVVALLQGAGAFTDSDIGNAAEITAASLVLSAQARLSRGQWRVTLSAVGNEPALTTTGEATDILAAARIATDIMARHLGLRVTQAGVPPDDAIAGLLQQVEAAMLADDMTTARRLLERLDDTQRQRPDVLYQRAMVDFRSGRLDLAEAALNALLEHERVRQDMVFHARVLNGLGNVLMRRDDLAAAERLADRAVTLLEDGKPIGELGRALTGRAIIRSSQNQFPAALADFGRARVILESVGDRFALARVNANIGILEARRDHLAEALPILAGSAETLAAFHDLTTELYTRITLAYVQLALRDPVAALAEEARLRELIEHEPDSARLRYANLARAQILLANGRLNDADRLLQQVSARAEQAGDLPILAWAQSVAARRKLAAGDADEAWRLATAALETDWEDEHPRAYATAWLVRVRAGLALGRPGPVAADAAAVAEWAGISQTRVARIFAALAEGEVAGDDEAAIAAFERALAEAEAGRVPDELLQVSEAYADYLIRTGRLARAGEIVARAADWANRDYVAALLQLRLYHALAQPAAWRHALTRAQALAGERDIPPQLLIMPVASS